MGLLLFEASVFRLRAHGYCLRIYLKCMSEQAWPISPSWTLFLDRDGVINVRLIDDYVKTWEEFEFIEGVLEKLAEFSTLFGTIVIVTNQQGIGKGLMSEADLTDIHSRMLEEIEQAGGRIDKIYHCPALRSDADNCRKPRPVMAYKAQEDFPNIDFVRSIMVGDSLSDIEFGRAVGMRTVWISDEDIPDSHVGQIDLHLSRLAQLSL